MSLHLYNGNILYKGEEAMVHFILATNVFHL